METLYTICAIVGGTLIVCQFLMTLLGIGGHHGADAGGGHDAGFHVGGHDAGAGHTAGHDVSHDAESSWFVGILTFRTLVAALAFFGLAGLATHGILAPMISLAVALAAGASALVIVGWLMKALVRLNVDGTARIGGAVGASGTVYLTVPGERAGVGKVMVNLRDRTIEYKAVTSQRDLPTGSKVRVVGVIGHDTLEVSPE